jgi:uncharacterized membrane protein YbaN (DUF454 family)
VEKERRVLDRRAPGLLKKIILHIAGIGLILLGIVGLFLPVLQGVLMIIVGLGLLSMGNEGVRRWVGALGKKYPRQAAYLRKIKMRVLTRRKSSWRYANDKLKERANDGR